MNMMARFARDQWIRGGVDEPMEERHYELAYGDFCGNLERLRKLVLVKTICMHGSPLSKLSNLELWKRYEYKELGIIGESYLDVDFDEVFLLWGSDQKFCYSINWLS